MEEFLPLILLLIVLVGLFLSTFRQDHLSMEALEALGRYKATDKKSDNWPAENLISEINGIPIAECNEKKFSEECKTVHRFFDHREHLGITMRQAYKKGFNPQILFRRKDGWGVTCESDGFEQTFKLYPDEWKEVWVKAGE